MLVFLLREGVPGPREGGLQPAPPNPNTALCQTWAQRSGDSVRYSAPSRKQEVWLERKATNTIQTEGVDDTFQSPFLSCSLSPCSFLVFKADSLMNERVPGNN